METPTDPPQHYQTMKVLQETPSLGLIQDPVLNSVNSEGLVKNLPAPPPLSSQTQLCVFTDQW